MGLSSVIKDVAGIALPVASAFVGGPWVKAGLALFSSYMAQKNQGTRAFSAGMDAARNSVGAYEEQEIMRTNRELLPEILGALNAETALAGKGAAPEGSFNVQKGKDEKKTPAEEEASGENALDKFPEDVPVEEAMVEQALTVGTRSMPSGITQGNRPLPESPEPTAIRTGKLPQGRWGNRTPPSAPQETVEQKGAPGSRMYGGQRPKPAATPDTGGSGVVPTGQDMMDSRIFPPDKRNNPYLDLDPLMFADGGIVPEMVGPTQLQLALRGVPPRQPVQATTQAIIVPRSYAEGGMVDNDAQVVEVPATAEEPSARPEAFKTYRSQTSNFENRMNRVNALLARMAGNSKDPNAAIAAAGHSLNFRKLVGEQRMAEAFNHSKSGNTEGAAKALAEAMGTKLGSDNYQLTVLGPGRIVMNRIDPATGKTLPVMRNPATGADGPRIGVMDTKAIEQMREMFRDPSMWGMDATQYLNDKSLRDYRETSAATAERNAATAEQRAATADESLAETVRRNKAEEETRWPEINAYTRSQVNVNNAAARLQTNPFSSPSARAAVIDDVEAMLQDAREDVTYGQPSAIPSGVVNVLTPPDNPNMAGRWQNAYQSAWSQVLSDPNNAAMPKSSLAAQVAEIVKQHMIAGAAPPPQATQ